jgi:hypothetical protein
MFWIIASLCIADTLFGHGVSSKTKKGGDGILLH